MTHPEVVVTVDGVPVSGAFFERLVRLTIVDREGIGSDALDLEFNNQAPFIQSPRRGAVVEVALHDGSGSFSGSFIVDTVGKHCLPYRIKVRAHSADLRSAMKVGRTKYWDDCSVKAIVEEKAGDHGLKVRISEKVSSHVYDWIGQQDESDLHFLERLARRHGALFTIKNGVLLWLERGVGQTAEGTAIPTVQISTSSIVVGTCHVTETDVERFGKVKAYWQDRKGAKRHEVLVVADPEAEGEHVLRDAFSSKEEAERAANAAAREMVRGRIETGCTVVGCPSLMAGQPLTYVGIYSEFAGLEFIPDLVRRSYSKSGGLRTAFTGKLRAE